MIKYSILLSLIVLSCNVGSEQQEEANTNENRPNILFILADDLGKEWISCYGAETIQTPNIDALAQSGIRFDHAYSMPQCTPSRLTFLTAQYPFRHGWVNHWDVPRWGGGAHFDENQYPQLVKKIKEAGYQTGIAGKWQIDDFRVEPDALTRVGFDAFCMWTGYETGIPASAERYQDPYIFTKEGSKSYPGQFGPDIFQDFIKDFLQQKEEQPFFLYYPMVLPHGPFINTPDETAETAEGRYAAMVRYVDKITGNIVKALEAANLRENTLIIWASDNGTGTSFYGHLNGNKVKGGKGRTIESGIAAPFIVSWPDKIKAGQTSEALIDFTDILPTCIELATNQKMATWKEDIPFPLDGQPFTAILNGTSTENDRAWILSMGGKNNAKLTEDGVENQYVFRDRVLRDRRFKLYINPSREADQFYDLLNDPMEQNNLIGKLETEEQKASFAKLSALIATFPERDADPKYTPNPKQEWDVAITAQSEVWKRVE